MTTSGERKWTPGPWRARIEREATMVWVDAPGTIAGETIAGPYARQILQEDEYPERIADAHLMAAAPALYEALAELVAIRDAVVEAGGELGPLAQERIEAFARRQLPAIDAARALSAKGSPDG